jgi:hypothetical protein
MFSLVSLSAWTTQKNVPDGMLYKWMLATNLLSAHESGQLFKDGVHRLRDLVEIRSKISVALNDLVGVCLRALPCPNGFFEILIQGAPTVRDGGSRQVEKQLPCLHSHLFKNTMALPNACLHARSLLGASKHSISCVKLFKT